jgi:RNA polymerase sigma factor (sigma-70 family)
VDPDSYKPDVVGEAKVFLDHKEFISKVISFRVHDEDEADDLFQDFFLTFIRRPLRRDIRDIRSYLYRMVTNHVIEPIARKERYRDRLREYAERTRHPARVKTPEESMLLADEVIKMFELIAKRLSRAQARAVRLRYRDGCTIKEIAQKMNVRIPAARGYISEGIRQLDTVLALSLPS